MAPAVVAGLLLLAMLPAPLPAQDHAAPSDSASIIEGFRRGRQQEGQEVRVRQRPTPAPEVDDQATPDDANTTTTVAMMGETRPVIVGLVNHLALTRATLQMRAEAQVGVDPAALDPDEFRQLLARTESDILAEWAINAVLGEMAREAGLRVTRDDMRTRLIELAEAAKTPGDPEAALARFGIDIEDYIIELEQAILTEKFVLRYIEQNLPESEFVKLYEQSQRDFTVPAGVRARAIMKDLSAASNDDEVLRMARDMENARRRLRRGEDFATVARELSGSLITGPRGGDLGWVTRLNTLPEPFNRSIFSFVPGRPTDILQSADGRFLYIFLVEEKRDESVVPYEQARPQLPMLIYDEVRQKLYDDHRRRFRLILNARGIPESHYATLDLNTLTLF